MARGKGAPLPLLNEGHLALAQKRSEEGLGLHEGFHEGRRPSEKFSYKGQIGPLVQA